MTATPNYFFLDGQKLVATDNGDGTKTLVVSSTGGGGGSSAYIAGPCWGLYVVSTPGTCGGFGGPIDYYTAVIGNGYSYWLKLAAGSHPVTGQANNFGFEFQNIFTPV